MFEKSTHKQAFAKASLPGCVVCHSNHGITHPSDANLKATPGAVCMRCHAPGDRCDQQRNALLQGLTILNERIKSADVLLGRAEASGMEVGEGRVSESEARDSLTKARVTIHSFDPELMEKDLAVGTKAADKSIQEGQKAMAERNYRRLGLGISLIAIGIVMFGLRSYVKAIEK